MADNRDLSIVQGKTFSLVLRWESEPIVYKAISGISLASGAPRPAVVGHGLPNGWRCAVTRVKGMKQINAANSPPRSSDYHPATVIDADTIELNDVAPYDDNGNEWPAYTGGGFIEYNTPVDLTGFAGRMEIKDKVGGTVLASTDDILVITVDNTAKTITLSITATDTAAISWMKGVYDLEMVSATGEVTSLLSGKVSVSKEVTT